MFSASTNATSLRELNKSKRWLKCTREILSWMGEHQRVWSSDFEKSGPVFLHDKVEQIQILCPERGLVVSAIFAESLTPVDESNDKAEEGSNPFQKTTNMHETATRAISITPNAATNAEELTTITRTNKHR